LQSDDNVLQAVTGQAPYQMGFDAIVAAIESLDGAELDAIVNTPTILFGRGDDASIDLFVETEGLALFGE